MVFRSPIAQCASSDRFGQEGGFVKRRFMVLTQAAFALERHLRDDFPELTVLGSQVFDFGAGRLSHRVAAQPALASLEEVLAPAVVLDA